MLRVLTLNIWHRRGPWELRRARIREGLVTLAPDLIGLQEVLCKDGQSQADEIAEGLGYHVAFGVAASWEDGEQFGNAVLSRWPLRRVETLPLPHGDTSQRRSLLCVEADAPGGPIPFFVTHLNWRFHESDIREAQAVELARKIKQYAPISGRPPILVGDFNAAPDSSEVRFLSGLQALNGESFFLADCFAHAGTGDGITYDPRRNTYAGPENTGFPRRLDYVFVRGPKPDGTGFPVSARVVLQEPDEGVWASDHYGVLAEIAI